MNEPSLSIRAAWHLVKPYWFSQDRWRGRALLFTIVAMSLAQVYISVRFNQWNGVFYNALEDKKFDVFIHQLGVFSVLAAIFIGIAVYKQYFTQMLQMRWRRWLTAHYQERWLSQRNYYRLQAIYHTTDNPDQRMTEDLDIFTDSTLSLSIGLLSSVVTLASFTMILWHLSGALEFHVGETLVSIPGYMLWAALLYAIAGTWLTHLIGRRLVSLSFNQQRFEANFRFSLVRVREHAETIAFYHGEPVERHALSERFGHILVNWWAIMRKQKQLTWFTSGYSQIAIIFPFVVAAPRYFSGAIPLGGLMQTASAFGQVQTALSWFVEMYPRFAHWKATASRLHGFTRALSHSEAEQVHVPIHIDRAGAKLVVHDLSLQLPDGSALLKGIDWELAAGERLLVTGDSGRGKTTLLRAIAGLWPYGEGEITLPQEGAVLFIPQKPYVPLLSLRDLIAYPQAGTNYSDAQIVEALTVVGLSRLAGELDNAESWGTALSLGEQQKLAFARVFLQKPELVLLDEATASLDEAAEAALYQLLIARLPQTILLSIGHRSSLQQWHTRTLAL